MKGDDTEMARISNCLSQDDCIVPASLATNSVVDLKFRINRVVQEDNCLTTGCVAIITGLRETNTFPRKYFCIVAALLFVVCDVLFAGSVNAASAAVLAIILIWYLQPSSPLPFPIQLESRFHLHQYPYCPRWTYASWLVLLRYRCGCFEAAKTSSNGSWASSELL